MRRSIALLSWVLLAAMTSPRAAQTTIHHCVGGDGHPVFTDQPCAALNATPLAPAVQPAPAGAEAPPPAVLCAANIDALKRAVIDAFAQRDANRMAGLMLWGGYGRGAAVADIRKLQQIMRESLLDIGPTHPGLTGPPSVTGAGMSAADLPELPELAGSGAPVSTRSASADVLILHTSGNDGSGQPRELRYAVVHRAGCLWLRNAT